MTAMTWNPRRVVTGHSPDGTSVVLSDDVPPVRREVAASGVTFVEMWNTTGMPAVVTHEEPEPTEEVWRVPPPPHGTVVRLAEFPPGRLSERGLQSPVHRTETIDYAVMIEGELVAIVDDTEVVVRAGDVLVQRGTDHAWANRSDAVARIAFILVDGTFSPELEASIGPEALARVSRRS